MRSTYRGVGVQVAAHVLDLKLQLLLGARLGSLSNTSAPVQAILSPSSQSYLEGKVLEEVGSAVGLVRLRAAARIDPHTDGRCLGPRRVLGSDLRYRVNWRPQSSGSIQHTVKPFFSVVDSVLDP